MHEWALADAVITTAIKVAKQEELKEITKVTIKIGELQSISKDIFYYALDEVLKKQNKLFQKTDFNLEIEKVIFKCRVCKNEWSFANNKKILSEDEKESIHFIPETAHTFIKCQKCGSPDFEIIKGRGILIDSIEGEK